MVKGHKAKSERRIFVLDTNVLMHDPTSIFRFEEHDIFIPMTVRAESPTYPPPAEVKAAFLKLKESMLPFRNLSQA